MFHVSKATDCSYLTGLVQDMDTWEKSALVIDWRSNGWGTRGRRIRDRYVRNRCVRDRYVRDSCVRDKRGGTDSGTVAG